MRSIANISFRGAATAALLFVSCVSGGHSTDPNKTNPDWGWRSAGLTASSADLGNGAGYQAIVHVGSHIFVMDARTLKGSQACRIFSTLQGIQKWDTLQLPAGLVPNALIADSPYVYVGMSSKGAVWRYNAENSTWEDLKTGVDSIYSIAGFGLYSGGVIASLASSQTSTRPVMHYKNGSWLNINQNGSFPNDRSFLTGIEYHGTFYAATYDTGVWAWTPSDSMWRKVTDPPYGKPTLSSLYNGYPRSMSIFNDSLYVGYWNGGGLDRYLGENSWNREDSCINYKSDGVSLSPCNSPVNIYASAIWNNHLIVSGYYSSIPVVDMAPAKPKGWSLLGGDTWKGGFTTYDMTVVGDTLYTASWEAVWKYPLSQLDSAVKMYSAYPQYPSSSSATTALTKKK